ncbi:MAG: glycosyltransferase family 2 protein, partial [bacterium]|nr:glycosyltransferase family 2 protein [bacterium]
MTNIKFNVSVGIPAYNEQENIGHLLNSILKQKEGNFDLKEIIVISDASNDGTGKIVRSFSDSRITLIENTVRVGQAQNQNKIIQKFSGDILLFLNADILLQNNYYIEKMIAPFYLNKNLGITSSRVVPLPAETFFEKIINFSVQIKEDMIYRINGGDNIYACHGRGRAFSGLLARQFEWNLTGAVSEDAYSYLK